MEDYLDKGPREVVDKNDLTKSGLKERLEMSFSGAWGWEGFINFRMIARLGRRKAHTSNPCSWSYDDIYGSFLRELVSSLDLDRTIYCTNYGIAGI